MKTSMPKPRITDRSRGAILQILFALLFLTVLTGQASAADCTASYTYTSTGGSSSYTLTSGKSLKIASGTYTGTVEFGSGSTICVETGATFAGSLNNPGGTLTNYGTTTLAGAAFNAGTSIDNYGTFTFSGNPNTNGVTAFYNRAGATMSAPTFQLGSNSTLTNDGILNATGDLNTTTGTTLTNNYRIEVDGNFNPDGTFTNYGRAYAKNFINMNSSATIINNCALVSYNGFNSNNPNVTNNGTILITKPNNKWQHNGSGVFRNGTNAKVAGYDFINSATVTGSGAMIFSGSTTNQGAFTGNSSSDKINFYDETQTGSQFFDFQNVTPTNTVRTAFTRPTELDSPTTCSAAYKGFASSGGCPTGMTVQSQSGNAANIVADIGVDYEAKALGTPVTSGTTANSANAAKVASGDTLGVDLGETVPGGEYLEISLARDTDTGLVRIETSLDNISYTSAGTFGNGGTWGPGTLDTLERLRIILPNGARYVRFIREAGSSWVDAISYSSICSTVNGAIAGTVYTDSNSNNTLDASETKLSNITVKLYDSTKTTVLQTTSTNATGAYSFTAVPVGTYQLEVDIADTDLPAGASIGTTNPLAGVSVTSGATTANQNFGFDTSSAACSPPSPTTTGVNSSITWNHNPYTPLSEVLGGHHVPSILNTALIASAANEVISNLTTGPTTWELYTETASVPATLAQAISGNKYFQYSFTTQASLSSDHILYGVAMSTLGPLNTSNHSGKYKMQIQMDDNAAFSSPTILKNLIQIDQDNPTTGGDVSEGPLYSSDFYISHYDLDTPLTLAASKTYYLRFYLYDDATPGVANGIANRIIFDDLLLKTFDCGAPPSTLLSVNDAVVTEGNSGLTYLNFPVQLSAAAPSGGVSFNYATADGTATLANSDYQSKTGTLTIPMGANGSVISVPVVGDTNIEPNEKISVNISNVVNAQFNSYPLPPQGSIIDDDAAVACNASSGHFGGIVFQDYNQNSTRESGEIGLAGITVTAYNSSNAAAATATTDTGGWYKLTGLTNGTQYRLEFTGLPTGTELGAAGSASATNVQFVTVSATCNANLGVYNPVDYCQADPKLLAARYVNGDTSVSSAGMAGTFGALLSYPYSASGIAPTLNQDALASQVGSVWGLAYNRHKKKAFASAMVRRHVGLGPLGIGGIYVIDYSGASPTVSNFLNVDGLASIDAGSIGNNSARGLPGDPYTANHDSTAFDKVGKEGLGDAELSDDGNTLYVTNLYSRKIIKVDLTTYNTSGTVPTTVTQINLPTVSCTNGVARPFGLKYYRGKLYAGITCTGENAGSSADLKASIHAYDGTSWTEKLQVPLNYQTWHADHMRSSEYSRTNIPWVSSMSALTFGDHGILDWADDSQLLLSGIEFDTNGDLLLGFIDRTGLQFGQANFGTDTSSSRFYGVFSNGELLKASYNASTGVYTLENAGSANGVAGEGAKTGADPAWPYGGPGGGEFYGGDKFVGHTENSFGALAVVPGRQELALNAMNPFNITTGGTLWLNNDTGTRTRGVQLYGDDNRFFGKAVGLGDIEVLCDPAPTEVGNRVWLDSDSDGIQDAGEAGINGVNVTLACGTDTATATTNTQGEYYFSNKIGGNATFMGSGESCTLSANNTQASLSTYTLTTQNADSKTDNNRFTDISDSDAVNNAGTAEIAFTVGSSGQNNHSLDFGYKSSVPPNNYCPIISNQSGNALEVYSSTGTISNPSSALGLLTDVNTPTDAINSAKIPSTTGAQITLDLGQTIPANASLVLSLAQDTSTSKVDIQFSADSIVFTSMGSFGSGGTLGGSTTDKLTQKAIIVPAGGVRYVKFLRQASSFWIDGVAYTQICFDGACDASQGEFGGIVFRDYNQNGIRESREKGVEGITVTAYDSSNTVKATATTDANGWYTLAGLTSGSQYRLEFTGLPSGLSAGAHGTDTATNMRFVTMGASCGINFAISDQAEYCQADPYVAVPTYTYGNSAVAAVGSNPGVYTFPYSATGNSSNQTPNPTVKSTIGQTGATWGTAYQASSKTLYTSAVMRRFVGFGTLSTGGIYKLDMSNPAAASTGATAYIDVRTLGIPTGNDVRNATACNSLATATDIPSHDVAAWDAVGKVGIGDIDYDETNRTLWLVNLNDKKLYGIRNISPTTPPVAADVLGGYAINLPAPYTCTSGVFRPWAVKYYRGQVYVGGVCDASSNPATANLKGYILKFDPANTGAGFSYVKDIPFDYNHPIDVAHPIGAWKGWISAAEAVTAGSPTNSAQHSPIISNIEFDTDESIIVGVIDRASMQNGNNAQNIPSCTNTTTNNPDLTGDILRLCKTDTGYIGDSEPGCKTNIPADIKMQDEYYWGDYGIYPDLAGDLREIALGGLALVPGTGEVVSTTYDDSAWLTNEVMWLNNKTGAANDRYYLSGNAMGKAAGLGELEVLCDPAPIEIGNRVWLDSDSDGVQDAGEMGIPDVSTTLTCGTDSFTATTDAQGEYYFSNKAGGNATFMGAGENCILRVVGSQASLSAYTLTTQNADSKTDNNSQTDIRDSDAVNNAGTAEIGFTVGSSGQNNHSLDMGYKPIPLGGISGKLFEDVNYGGGAGRSFGTAGAAGTNGTKVELYNSTGAFVNSTTTATDGSYSFSSLAAGNYYVRVVNDTVKSTRTGSDGTERGIQTYRTDGTTASTNEVGGRKPASVDAAANTTSQTLNTTTFLLSGGGQAQSVQPVTIAAANISGVDFGFNFSTVVNTNDSGQGSLRQGILNINLLANTGLAQAGQDNTYGVDTAVVKEVLLFNIPASGDPLGRTDICGGSTCKITINSQLPAVSKQPAIIDGTTQPGYVAGTPGVPLIHLVPATGLDSRGFTMEYDAPDSTFRGFAITGFRNLLTNRGITVNSERTIIESNYIGVKPDGTADGNGNGIELQWTQSAVIGGTTAAKRNIISANKALGIFFNTGASGSVIQNNYIGTNPAGTAAMGNESTGIDTEGGSGTKILDNIISGNWNNGIELGSSGGTYGTNNAIIQGNRIGVGVNGENIKNMGPGIMNYGGSSGHIIGGTNPGQGNIIAYNFIGGIKMYNTSIANVVITGNSIYANGNLGIDLGNDGVTVNDASDADTGANSLLNFPVLSELTLVGGNLTVKGCAPTGATVELFEADVSTGGKATPGDNRQGKSKDYGEGQTYLTSFVEGSASDTDSTDCAIPPDADLNNQTGMKAFSVTIPKPASVVEGDSLTTTATRAADGTSEFSPIYTYSTACSLVVTSTADSNNVSNNSGSLRDAIECANSTPATDTITFNIPTSQPGYTNPDGIAGNGDEYWSIQPSTPLPGITQPLTIDGSTQPGTTCPQPRVEIDGSSAGAEADGIGLYASNSTIKGLIINDFSRYGIRLSRFPITFPVGNTLQTNNTVQCSYIGVNANGLVAKPNLQGGIAAEGDSMKIGGTTVANRNIISGNGEFGIYFYGGGSTNGTVQGNYIGVGANGTTALGNQGFGIGYYNTDGGGLIGGTAGVTVNGACTGTCNLIAHNTSAGIGFFYTGPAGRNVRISGNAIHSNGGIGIDLERSSSPWVLDGVNPNDTGDSDSAFAPNALQNYPVLTSAALNTTTTDITGTLNSIANATFTLEFFANTSSDPSGYGEGERYLGNTTITTNGSGNASFTLPLPLVAQGTYITATATDANNNTSEFSSAIMATAVKDISGKVFEDVNYGGGAGRDFLAAGSGAANVGGAQVELYNSSNTLLDSTTTAADGSYTFTSIPVGTYSVKVVSNTVSSTRAGSNDSELGVMTYRTDGVTPATTDIGGQATQPITLATTNLNNVSFGFNFDTVSNTNDSGAGSLRQFIINANLLGGDSSLNQLPYTAGKENAVLALTTSDPNYGSGYWSIALQSTLPAISSPIVLDGSLSPFNGNPVLELKGTNAGTGTNGITLAAGDGGSTIRKLAINGFGGAGIYLNTSNNNILQGNHLGVTPSGAARANTGAGILLNAASSNLIGGTASGEGNLIANNGGDGIAITGATSLTNTILGNSIHTNTGLGIDLGDNGVTANDAGDTDSGPNNLLNFPDVQDNSFGANGTKIITYDFDLDVPAGDYRLEFFASTTKDPSNHGEGQTFIGYKDLNGITSGSHNIKGTFNATLTVVKGTPIAATLTQKTTATTFGATSEFSGIREGITTQVCDSLVGGTGSDMVIDETDPTTIIRLLEAWDYSTAPPTPIAYVISGGEDGSLFTVTNPTAGATLPCATIKFISSDVVITKSASADAETRAIVPPGYLPPPGNYELPLDKDKDNVYDFQVTGTTASGKKYVRDLSVRVMNTNEAPIITSAAAVSFSEDSSANVLDIASQDPDAGTVEGKGLSYHINGGVDASHFEVAAATGILRFRAVPDYDAPMDTNRDNLYEVEVSVTDTGGLKASKLFKVSVMNNTADDGVLLNVRVLLQGAYDSKTALMSDDLNVLGLLPGKQPYKATLFSHTGTETLSTMLQETSGNNAPVDWILVELRSSPASVVASRAVMLQRDGDLVDSQTGSANLHFAKVKAGNYYVSVRHRNHLGIISASPVSLDNTVKLLNFASSSTTVKGEETRLVAGKLAMMWAGDINGSNTLTANGPGNDVTSLMSGVITSMDNLQGNTNHILSGYLATDLNMDGKTLFTGPGNDTSLLVGNIILHPLNTGFAANYIVKGGLQ